MNKATNFEGQYFAGNYFFSNSSTQIRTDNQARGDIMGGEGRDKMLHYTQIDAQYRDALLTHIYVIHWTLGFSHALQFMQGYHIIKRL